MIASLKQTCQQYWQRWIHQRNPIEHPLTLTRNHLFILPSRYGMIYTFVWLSLLLGAINYQLSMAFLLCFIMLGIGLMSAWQAHENLKDLMIRVKEPRDCFCGQETSLTICFLSKKNCHHLLVSCQENHIEATVDFISHQTNIVIRLPAQKRGYHFLPTFKISSLWPFSLFRVWGYARFKQGFYVYPKPIDPGFWPEAQQSAIGTGVINTGNDDFHELQETSNPWILPGRIAWKAMARTNQYLIKHMVEPKGEYYLFDLSQAPGKDLEQKLSHLSFWLYEAEQKQMMYALKLNNTKTAFKQGEAHLQECLRLLAVYS